MHLIYLKINTNFTRQEIDKSETKEPDQELEFCSHVGHLHGKRKRIGGSRTPRKVGQGTYRGTHLDGGLSRGQTESGDPRRLYRSFLPQLQLPV